MSLHETFRAVVNLHRAGQFAESERLLRSTLASDPNSPDLLVHLATAVRGLGRLEEAIELQRRAVAARPDFAEAWTSLGIMLLSAGRPDEAEAASWQAVILSPLSPNAQCQWGTALMSLGRSAQAVEAFTQAVRLQPAFFQAWYNLGVLLQQAGQLDKAKHALGQAITIHPNSAEAMCALGNVHLDSHDWEPAHRCYQRALTLNPMLVEARYGLGSVMRELGNSSEAASAFAWCVQARPGNVLARRGLAIAYGDEGRFDEALAIHQQLAAENPSDPILQFDLACELLLRGDWDRGWPLYEARLRIPRLAPRNPGPYPQWDGGDLDGRTILLDCEQGYGDTIQFARYLPLVRSRNGRVLLRCQAALARLLEGQFDVEAILPETTPLPPGIDVQCTLPSLPHWFRTAAATIPSKVPYIRAAPNLVDSWQAKLGPRRSALRVGLAWAGSPAHLRDRRRSMDVAYIESLAARLGDSVEWFSLQKQENGRASGFAKPDIPGLVDHTADLTDFAQTAALIAQLDIVLTVDTSVAHLAGAMGLSVWVMLPFVPDWRWQLGRVDSIWYPSMRLFRQPRLNDWASVIDEVAEALRKAQPIAPTSSAG